MLVKHFTGKQGADHDDYQTDRQSQGQGNLCHAVAFQDEGFRLTPFRAAFRGQWLFSRV
jgi:hypothetical protein